MARLRWATGRGELTLDEFEARLDAVYRARTHDDLDGLVRWLAIPATPPRSTPRPRTRIYVTAAAVAIAAVLSVARAATVRTSVPVVTRVGVGDPFHDGRTFPVIQIAWPHGSHGRMVESGDGERILTNASPVVDYSVRAFPVSYRAAVCVSACATGSAASELAYGPWYRPNVNAQIAQPPPTVTATSDGQTETIVIRLREHQAAPVVALFRNDALLTTLSNDATTVPGTGSTLMFATATQPGNASVTYTAAACYTDCVPTSIDSGFAQMTARGQPTRRSRPA